MQRHRKIVEHLQKQIQKRYPTPLSLYYRSGHSNTTRSKSYKNGSFRLDCSQLNRVISVDKEKMVAFVEPRVTMEDLVDATLKEGLIPLVVPEFKGITVGGAIMGGAAESSSHIFGIFNDTCSGFELLSGNGTHFKASEKENPDLFYGLAGSYGSLGLLTLAEVKLRKARPYVHLHPHVFKDSSLAIDWMRERVKNDPPDFLEGIVFGKEETIVIEGTLKESKGALPTYSTKSPFSPWYFDKIREAKPLSMKIDEYLFRYDQGAFWMGAYLFKPGLLSRFFLEGVFKFLASPESGFNSKQIEKFHQVNPPNLLKRALFASVMSSQRLWGLLHKAEKWVQDRFIIQDFCLPEDRVDPFLKKVLDEPGTFPLWLCPIKGTETPQIFAPHNQNVLFINVGVYGLSSYASSLGKLTQELENKTFENGGRKVLYSRSYYTEENFWKIYPKEPYLALREKTHANGVWKGIEEKVLSD